MRHRGLAIVAAATLAGLVLSCASVPPGPAAGMPCAAVGRLVLEGPGGGFDVTAVLHFSPPEGVALRLVDPTGKSRAELRSDGRTIRISSRDERTHWETDAPFELLGVPMNPDSLGRLLAGRPLSAPGWTVRGSDDRGECLPRRVVVESVDRPAGEEVRLEWSWEAFEPWSETALSLGPPPDGSRRVDSPPWGARAPAETR